MAASDSADVEVQFTRQRAIEPGDATRAASWIIHEFPVPPDLAAALPTLLAKLLEREMLRGEVIEYIHSVSGRTTLAGFGLSGFLNDHIAADYLAAPYPHFELTLLDRVRRSDGGDVFLDHDQIAQANAGAGLTLFPLLWLQRSNDPAFAETHALLTASQQGFLRIHRGYRIVRILKETTADRASVFLGGGFREYRRLPIGTPMQFDGHALRREHVVFEASRADVETSLPASMIAHLLTYQPPRCSFTRSERRVLERAVEHQTDEEIASSLRISSAAVRLRWRSIYARVAAHIPAVFKLTSSSAAVARGKEKRRRVIAYVAAHLEEIRPYP